MFEVMAVYRSIFTSRYERTETEGDAIALVNELCTESWKKLQKDGYKVRKIDTPPIGDRQMIRIKYLPRGKKAKKEPVKHIEISWRELKFEPKRKEELIDVKM